MLQNDVIFISVASLTLPMKTSPKIHQGPMGRSSPMKPEMHWGVLGPDYPPIKYLGPDLSDYQPIKR